MPNRRSNVKLLAANAEYRAMSVVNNEIAV